MSADMPIRHVASIAGAVQEKNDEKPLRIANALIRIIVHQAPPEFQSMVSIMLDTVYADSFDIERRDSDTQLDKGQIPDALRDQFQAHGRLLSPERAAISVAPIEIGSTWQLMDAGKSYVIWRMMADRLTVCYNTRQPGLASRQLRQRIDQTRSGADGIFCFVNLPTGDYILRTSVPEMGSRYGTAETDPAHPVQVQPTPDRGQPAQVAQVTVTLPPTRIFGKVTRLDNAQPVSGARVRLRGDTAFVRTDDTGKYDLRRLVAGKPTVEVTASGFKPGTHQVDDLKAGQEREANLRIESK